MGKVCGNIAGIPDVTTLRAIQALEKELVSLGKTLSTLTQNNAIVTSHANLTDLAYADAGHTGFASSASLTTHINAADPHPQYLTQAEADVLYETSGLIGQLSYSGLQDVQSTNWTSGYLPIFNGTQWLPVASTTWDLAGTALAYVSAHVLLGQHTQYASVNRTLTAGSGLTGGGTLSADRRFDVGEGTGIIVNADSIEIDFSVVAASGNYAASGAYVDETGDKMTGTLTMSGARIHAYGQDVKSAAPGSIAWKSIEVGVSGKPAFIDFDDYYAYNAPAAAEGVPNGTLRIYAKAPLFPGEPPGLYAQSRAWDGTLSAEYVLGSPSQIQYVALQGSTMDPESIINFDNNFDGTNDPGVQNTISLKANLGFPDGASIYSSGTQTLETASGLIVSGTTVMTDELVILSGNLRIGDITKANSRGLIQSDVPYTTTTASTEKFALRPTTSGHADQGLFAVYTYSNSQAMRINSNGVVFFGEGWDSVSTATMRVTSTSTKPLGMSFQPTLSDSVAGTTLNGNAGGPSDNTFNAQMNPATFIGRGGLLASGVTLLNAGVQNLSQGDKPEGVFGLRTFFETPGSSMNHWDYFSEIQTEGLFAVTAANNTLHRVLVDDYAAIRMFNPLYDGRADLNMGGVITSGGGFRKKVGIRIQEFNPLTDPGNYNEMAAEIFCETSGGIYFRDEWNWQAANSGLEIANFIRSEQTGHLDIHAAESIDFQVSGVEEQTITNGRVYTVNDHVVSGEPMGSRQCITLGITSFTGDGSLQNGGTADCGGTSVEGLRLPRPGSVTAFSYQYSSWTHTTNGYLKIIVQADGTQLFQYDHNFTASEATGGGFSVTFPRNTYTFTADQLIGIKLDFVSGLAGTGDDMNALIELTTDT